MPKPFGRRVLVKPHQQETVLKDDSALSEYGEVIAIGPEVKTIEVGDVIGFSVFGVEKLIIGEEKHYFILESDDFILANL